MRYPTLGLLLAIPAAVLAQGQTEPVEIPVDPASIDITGTWSYSTSNHRVAGRCPNGTPMAGTLAITQTGGDIGLMVTSGAVCNPGSMCMYDGRIEDGNLMVSNTDTVDDEGGTVTNAMRLQFYSDALGSGEAASEYVHPDGFSCQWTHQVEIWRSEG